MGLYKYCALESSSNSSEQGQVFQGFIQSPNRKDAIIQCQNLGWKVLSCHRAWLSSAPGNVPLHIWQTIHAFYQGGIPLVQSLHHVASLQGGHWAFIFYECARRVAAGEKFTETLERYPNQFSKWSRFILEQGENNHQLSRALETVVAYENWRMSFQRDLKEALFYPSILMISMMILGSILSFWVFPQFQEILTSFNQKPSFLSSLILSFYEGGWVIVLSLFLIIVLGGAIFLIPQWGPARLQDYIRTLGPHIPVLGYLRQSFELSQWLGLLHILLQGGTDFMTALGHLEKTFRNQWEGGFFQKWIQSIQQGIPAGKALSALSYIPRPVSILFQSGVETNHLDVVVGQLAQFYKQENQRLTKQWVRLVGPLSLMMMGLWMICMVMGLILPIYDQFTQVSL